MPSTVPEPAGKATTEVETARRERRVAEENFICSRKREKGKATSAEKRRYEGQRKTKGGVVMRKEEETHLYTG